MLVLVYGAQWTLANALSKSSPSKQIVPGFGGLRHCEMLDRLLKHHTQVIFTGGKASAKNLEYSY